MYQLAVYIVVSQSHEYTIYDQYACEDIQNDRQQVYRTLINSCSHLHLSS